MRFSIGGFGVELKPSFFVMCAVLAAVGKCAALCVLVFSVVLHEAAHILTAMAFGLKTSEVVITPVGLRADIKNMETVSLFRRIIILLAGPAVNLILFFISGSAVNLMLFGFNVLPVYPLDGGRLLHYILGYFLGVLRANRVQSLLSRAAAVIIFLLGFVQIVLFYYNCSLLCIGLYLIKINAREYINMTFAFYRSIIYRSDKKVMPVRGLAAGEGISLKTVVYRLGWDYYTVIYLRDNNGRYTRRISETELVNYIIQNGIGHSLGELP